MPGDENGLREKVKKLEQDRDELFRRLNKFLEEGIPKCEFHELAIQEIKNTLKELGDDMKIVSSNIQRDEGKVEASVFFAKWLPSIIQTAVIVIVFLLTHFAKK